MPIPPPSEAERQALREERRRRRTCHDCGKVMPRVSDLDDRGYCASCAGKWMTREELRIADAFDDAVWWARHLLAMPAEQWGICDTETSDLQGEVIQIAAIAGDGTVLLDTLIHPQGTISAAARAIHHITDDELRTAPTFPDCYAAITTALSQCTKIVFYNQNFDTAIIDGDCRRHGLPPIFSDQGKTLLAVEDAMVYYAQYVGEWSDFHRSFRWPALPGVGHSALMDCYAVRDLIMMMAADTRSRGGDIVSYAPAPSASKEIPR